MPRAVITSLLAVLAAVWLPVCCCAVMTLSGQGCGAGGGLTAGPADGLARAGGGGGCSEHGCGGGGADVACDSGAEDGAGAEDAGAAVGADEDSERVPGPGCERCTSCTGGAVWLVSGAGAGAERVAELCPTGWVEVVWAVPGWRLLVAEVLGVAGPPGGGGGTRGADGAWAVARANRAGLCRWGGLRI